jgi:hypothetical protein
MVSGLSVLALTKGITMIIIALVSFAVLATALTLTLCVV